MIYGIGTDIVEVTRIQASLDKFGDMFAKRVLAESEWPEYLNNQFKARFVAKRFAAKEAFSKALGTGMRDAVSFQNIAVSHDALGKPILNLAAELQVQLDAQHIKHSHLSISDEKNMALAFVVLEQ